MLGVRKREIIERLNYLMKEVQIRVKQFSEEELSELLGKWSNIRTSV